MTNQNSTRYLHLAEQITSKIRRGVYAVGTDLPTEAEFCEQYGVSRFTVREALRRIEAVGLIEKQQGRGSQVISAKEPTTFKLIGQSEEDVLRYTAHTRLEFRDGGSEVPATVARKLGLDSAKEWVGLTGIRWAAQTLQPIAVVNVYVRAKYAAALKDLGSPVTSAIFPRIVEHGGLHLSHIEQLVSAVKMPTSAARRLGCEPGVSALQVIRRFSAVEVDPFEVAISWHAPNFEFSVTMEPTVNGSEIRRTRSQSVS